MGARGIYFEPSVFTDSLAFSWYDNEWGYVNRYVELARKVAASL